MDGVNGLFNNNPPAGSAAAPSANTGAPQQQEFLKLLVAQLQHQDPLQPQDGAAFVAQLAQFASLEQAAETNQHLVALGAAQQGAQGATLAALVGRVGTARADTLTIAPPAGAPPPLTVHLEGAASKVEVDVLDGSGRIVKTINLGATASGDTPVGWDAPGAPQTTLPPGSYSIKVHATGADGKDMSGAFAEIRGLIQKIDFSGGAPRFRIGSATVSPADILSIEN